VLFSLLIFLRSGKTLNKRNLFFTCGSAIVSLVFLSCSSVRIPSVPDYRLERQVADEAAPILRVTEDRDEARATASGWRIFRARIFW
jgi:hypothetical protein